MMMIIIVRIAPAMPAITYSVMNPFDDIAALSLGMI